MTDKAPEPLDLIAQLNGRIAFCRNRGEVKTPTLLTQAATALEAANARIAELEARPSAREWYDAFSAMRNDINEIIGNMPSQESTLAEGPEAIHETVVVVEAVRSAFATARAEALEEAERACTCKICAGTIRALKEKPNG